MKTLHVFLAVAAVIAGAILLLSVPYNGFFWDQCSRSIYWSRATCRRTDVFLEAQRFKMKVAHYLSTRLHETNHLQLSPLSCLVALLPDHEKTTSKTLEAVE